MFPMRILDTLFVNRALAVPYMLDYSIYLIFLAYPQGTHGFSKKISPFGLSVWPAIANIFTNIHVTNGPG